MLVRSCAKNGTDMLKNLKRRKPDWRAILAGILLEVAVVAVSSFAASRLEELYEFLTKKEEVEEDVE